jgi:argininosuccinate lyase
LKGLPSAYDKDLQEDKPAVFEAAHTLLTMLRVTAGAIASLSVKADRMQAALDPAMLATDLADYAVARGVPFREAHAITGRAVRRAIELGVKLDQLSLSELQSIHPVFAEDVSTVFDVQAAIDRRSTIGGTGAVRQQLEQAKNYLKRDA